MLDRKFREHDQKPSGEKVVFVTATKTLEPYEQCVRCTVTDALGSYTITLPNVSRCVGMIIAIHCILRTGSAAVTVADAGDSEDWANKTLNATGEGTLLYSDGRKWWELQADYS